MRPEKESTVSRTLVTCLITTFKHAVGVWWSLHTTQIGLHTWLMVLDRFTRTGEHCTGEAFP